MKTKMLLVPCWLIALAFVSVSAFSQNNRLSEGLIGEKVAVFLPDPENYDRVSSTFCLLSQPVIQKALPADWKLKPVFENDGFRKIARIAFPAGTDLYGTGEVTGNLRRNNTEIELWNTDNFCYKTDSGRHLYQSHPWVMGVRPNGTAFGVIFLSTWKAELACGNEIRFSTCGHDFPVIIIDAESPKEVLQKLAQLTGTIELPPFWALGFQQCRWSYNPDSKVREIAKEFRARHIPCDVIWMDIDYMDGFRVFTFDKKQFPDPALLNADLHKMGFKSVWMIDPGVKYDTAYSVYKSGHALDVFTKRFDGKEFVGHVWPGPTVFPDFTNPKTCAWWAGLYKDYMATGIDGVWNDMNEPSSFPKNGPAGTMPVDNIHQGNGASGVHLQYHNVYGMCMVKASKEGILAANPDKRVFVLTRSNFLGGQRYAATWTGDNASSEEHFRMSIPMSLNLGLSGQPFNGPDLGGFAENASPELWAKWVGTGVFFPFCRAHACKGTNDKEPWAFGEQVEKTARMALQRRYRLLPYLYTLFEESSRNGLPVMRPVFMADPKDLSLRTEEKAFMLGDNLLVVPRWDKEIRLPKGEWPEISLVKGDLNDSNQVSLRMKSGSIIPVGNLVEYTAQCDPAQTQLFVALDANNQAEGSVYFDAGEGFAYKSGDFCRVRIKAEMVNGKLNLRLEAREGNREFPLKKAVVHLIDVKGTDRVVTVSISRK